MRFGASAIALRVDELDQLLALRERPRRIELLGEWPGEALSRLPDVAELVAHELGQAELEALLAAPCAGAIESLDLAGSRVLEFVAGRALPACHTLSLAQTEASFTHVQWEHAFGLRELDISLTRHLTYDTESMLAATPHLVVLRANEIQELSIDAVVALRSLQRVEVRNHLHGFAEALRRRIPSSIVIDDWPADVQIDLLDRRLRLVGGVTPAIYVDDVRRALVTTLSSVDSMTSSVTQAADAKVIDLVARSVAAGAARTLTATGCRLEAELLPIDNHVWATIELSPAAVVIELEHYID